MPSNLFHYSRYFGPYRLMSFHFAFVFFSLALPASNFPRSVFPFLDRYPTATYLGPVGPVVRL